MKTDDHSQYLVRVEDDALGTAEVPRERLWDPQTQRSHLDFPIGVKRCMPALQTVSRGLTLFVFVGFASVPVAVMAGWLR